MTSAASNSATVNVPLPPAPSTPPPGASQAMEYTQSTSHPHVQLQQSSRLVCKVCGASFVYPGSYAKHMQKHEMTSSAAVAAASPPPPPPRGKDDVVVASSSSSSPSGGASQKKSMTSQRPIAPATAAAAAAAAASAVAPQTVLQGAPSMMPGYYTTGVSMAPDANVLYSLKELEASNSLRCQVCGRQFKYKSCLITHMETKHSASLQAANPMQQLASPMVSVNPKVSSLHCEFCGEVFVYHANLMKHKYKVHRELMQSYATASSLSGGSHHATMATTGQTTLPARGDEAKAGGGGSGDIYRGSAFSSYVSAASHSGSLAPGGARGTSPPPVEVKVKKEKEGGGGDEGSQDATPDPSQVRFPRPMYECPLCKMTFVYGASFMKHMTSYHPGEACPYMGPITQEKYFTPPQSSSSQQQIARSQRAPPTSAPSPPNRGSYTATRDSFSLAPSRRNAPPPKQDDFKSIFERASLRIAGIRQEGLKNLSSGFSFDLNADGGSGGGGGNNVSNGEVDPEKENDGGETENKSDGGKSDGESSGTGRATHHASVIVDASEVRKYPPASVVEAAKQQVPSKQQVLPKLPELVTSNQLYKKDLPATTATTTTTPPPPPHQQSPLSKSGGGSGSTALTPGSNWRIVSRKCYVCPVCRMEFVYGASFIKHMRRYHPDASYDLPKTTRTRPPSLAAPGSSATVPTGGGGGGGGVASEEASPSSKPDDDDKPRVSMTSSATTVNIPILPAPVPGLKGDSPTAKVAEGRGSPATMSLTATTTNQSGNSDRYQARRTRQCPCCSAVFVYVGSLIKHMTKCHPGSSWLTESGDLRTYFKQEDESAAAAAAVASANATSAASTAASSTSEPRKDFSLSSSLADAVSRRGQRVHYCRVCSKPFFYIASLHKHLLDHGVSPEEVVGLTSLTNPKEEASGLMSTLSTGMISPSVAVAAAPTSSTGGYAASSSASVPPPAKRLRLESPSKLMIDPDESLDDEPSHTMSLRSRATRLPVSYAEAEVEEFEFVESDDDEIAIIINNANHHSQSGGGGGEGDAVAMQTEATVTSQLALPVRAFDQAQHTVLGCMQQAYYALVALESLQQLVRFDQTRLPMAEVARLLVDDPDGVASLANANAAVATMLQGGNALTEALTEIQTALHERAGEFNVHTVNSVHSEVLLIDGRNFVLEAPATGAGRRQSAAMKVGETYDDEDRRHGVPSLDDDEVTASGGSPLAKKEDASPLGSPVAASEPDEAPAEVPAPMEEEEEEKKEGSPLPASS
ncbi:uncharacterized protein [Oscarella lobularis]|uniref:uncharacterized protein isoform X2 n=1 Tax=Oscarella lobularis TaxID=121494 RepID=UPI003313435C